MHAKNIYATRTALAEWAGQGYVNRPDAVSLDPRLESFGANTRLAIDVTRFGSALTTFYAYATKAVQDADTSRDVNVGAVVYADTTIANNKLSFWSGSAWTVDAFSVATALRAAFAAFAAAAVIVDGVPIPGPPGSTDFADMTGDVGAVPFTPTGGAPTTIQQELDKVAAAGPHFLLSLSTSQSIAFDKSVKTLRTHGYSSVNDGGAASYKRVNSAPAHAGNFRTLDRWTADGNSDALNGGWWEINEAVHNVRAFGAKGDDSNDDATAINLAIQAAYVRGTNTVYIPAGIYRVDNSGVPIYEQNGSIVSFVGIAVQYSNLRLYGDGRGRSIIRPTPGRIRHKITFGSGLENIHIHDLELKGEYLGSGSTGDHGIRLYAPCKNVLIERVYAHHNGGYGVGVAYHVDFESRAEFVKFVDCEFSYNDEGTDIHRGGHVEYHRCLSHHNVIGGFDGRGADLIYDGCRAWRNGGDGFGAGPISENWPENRVTFTDCFAYENNNGVKLRDAADAFPLIDPIPTSGAADAYTSTAVPTIASLMLGSRTVVTFHTVNLTATPRINVSDLGLKKILEDDETPVIPGRLITSRPFNLSYRPKADGGNGAWVIVNSHYFRATFNGIQAWRNTTNGLAAVAGRGSIELNGCQSFENGFGFTLTQQEGNGYHDGHNLTVHINGGSYTRNYLQQIFNNTLPANLQMTNVDVISEVALPAVQWDAAWDVSVKGGRIIGGTNGLRLRALTPPTATGIATAYALNHTAAQGIRPQLNRWQRIGVIFNVASGAAPTINVDGLGAKKLLNFGGAALTGGEFNTTNYYFFEYQPAADSGNGAWVRRRPPFFTTDADFQGQSAYSVNTGNFVEGQVEGGSVSGVAGVQLLTNSGRVVVGPGVDLSRVTGTKISDPSGMMIKDYGDVLHASAVFNPSPIVDGSAETTTISVPGARLADFAQVAFSEATSGMIIIAWVSAPDVVSVRFQNETGSTTDAPSGTLFVRVKRRPD